MRYIEHAPSPALRDRVECFWSIHAPAGAPGHRVLPDDGCVDILFDLSGSPVVVGAMTRALVTETTAATTELLGVRFRPGEAASVLGVSLRELSDGTIDLEDVWGARGRRVSDAAGAALGRGADRAALARDRGAARREAEGGSG